MRRRSRYSRVEERRAKQRIAKYFFATAAIVAVLAIFGPRALVRVSLFLDNNRGATNSVVADHIAPIAPTLEQLPVATSSARIRISGFGEPETTVVLYQNGSKSKESLIDDNGEFLFGNITLRSGPNEFFAESRDAAGNTSKPSEVVSVALLTKPPKLEIVSPQHDSTVNDETIVIRGTVDQGARITIDDRFVSVAPDQSFSFTTRLSEGENTFTVTARDSAGNETTTELTVSYQP